jgi:hypothetical protein
MSATDAGAISTATGAISTAAVAMAMQQFALTLSNESFYGAELFLSEQSLSIPESARLWYAICQEYYALGILSHTPNALKSMIQRLFQRGLRDLGTIKECISSQDNIFFGRNALAIAVQAYVPSSCLIHTLLDLYEENPTLYTVNPNARNSFGESLINEVARCDSISVFHRLALLSADDSLNNHDRNQRTPLVDLILVQAYHPRFERICVLLDETITRSDGTGVCILNTAAQTGCVTIADYSDGEVDLLVQEDVLDSLKTIRIRTPLQVLRDCKRANKMYPMFDEIERLLLAAEYRIIAYRQNFIPFLDTALSAFLPVTVLRHTLIVDYVLAPV